MVLIQLGALAVVVPKAFGEGGGYSGYSAQAGGKESRKGKRGYDGETRCYGKGKGEGDLSY